MATNITVDSIQFKYRQSDSVTNPFLKQAEEVKELDTGRSKVGPVGGGYWNDLPYTDEATIEAATDAAAGLVAGATAGLLPKPSGGTNGQALIKSGTNVVWGDVTSQSFQVVYHGADASYPRPAGASAVMWVGTVNPLNRVAGDVVALAAPAPLPDIVIWSDAFTTDGALGNTEVGGKPWIVYGTGYTAARVGGKLKFTAGTTSVGLAVADAGVADGKFTATVSTKGASNQAGIIFRGSSLNNHLALVRVSSTDAHYAIKRRVSGVYNATLATTTVTMADGDLVVIDMAGTTVTVTINAVVAWTGTITDYATATQFGAYCGASTSVTEMAYDTMSFTVAA